MTTHVVSESRLARLEGYPFEARYSVRAEAEAVRLAELAKDAYEYFRRLFPDTEPKMVASDRDRGQPLLPVVWEDGAPRLTLRGLPTT